MNQLQTNERCGDIIRMGLEAFKNLCEILKRDGRLRPTKLATIEEQVAKFLYILSHNDCVGAIDGTHVRVKVSREDAPRYHGRKGYPTLNVLAACSFDLKFTYVLPGWEGTASDSRIIKNALIREDKLIIPNDPDESLIEEVDNDISNELEDSDDELEESDDENIDEIAIEACNNFMSVDEDSIREENL
ncbi:hypothetical protein Dsin_028545 [Dipteronia sinensis]|uniref:DDE Tnp4 domain-containing protein n=1 Tax=Dipteronia sinensis TaxID=43782 RepID=A0AAD9ZRB3_9ROSI|nr:hypothetical protein Dsin_028545 [Dipteronia sinensis]